MTTENEWIAQAEVALEELASIGVEGLLKALGMKGGNLCWNCPVQRYVTRQVPLPAKVEWAVGHDYLTLTYNNHATDVCITLPEEVANFVGRFDNNEIPELLLTYGMEDAEDIA